MGNAQFAVVTCISNSFFSKNSVRAMGNFENACCLSLGRCSEAPYLAEMFLAKP